MSKQDLRFRLVALLLIAVLPAAVLAVVTAVIGYQDARAYKAAALAQSALLISAEESDLLRRAELTLRAAAANPVIAEGGSGCAAALTALLAGASGFTGAGLVGAGGVPLCAAGGFDRLDPRSLDELAASMRAAPSEMRLVAAGDRLLYALPLGSDTLVLVAPPLRLDRAALPANIGGVRAAVVTTGPLHPVSTEPKDAQSDWLPAESALPGGGAKVAGFAGQGDSGRPYLYAATPLGHGVYVLVGAPLDRLLGEQLWQFVLAIGLPLTVLLVAVAVAWFAVDRLVLRWIMALRRAAAAYGRGDLRARAATPLRMPAEIRELALAFNGMANAAEARAEDLETALQAKSRLLRELHHRVKNNFQVIASLLSLQKRAVGSREREVLRYPEDRVQALATAYRVSYAAGDIGNVPVARLAQEILDYIRQTTTAPGALSGDIGCERIEVDLDTAIPLALLMVEALSPSLEAARQSGRPVRFAMRCDGGDLTLVVSGPPPPAAVSEEQRLSARLALAFVHQIEGRLEVEEGDPQVMRVTIPAHRLHVGHDGPASPG